MTLLVALAAACTVCAVASALATTAFRRLSRWVLLVIAAASAWFSGAAPASPAGGDLADALLLGAVGAVSATAGARASTAALLVSCAIATAAAAGSDRVSAALMLSAVFGTAARGARRPPPALGAGVAAVLVNIALRLSWPRSFGATTVVGLVIVAPVLVSAVSRRLRARRRVGRALVIVTPGVAAGLFGLLLTFARARANSDQAMLAALEGISAAQVGDTDGAKAGFERAREHTEDVDAELHRWWVRPVLAIPIASQNLRAASAAVDAAHDLVAVGSELLRTVDIDSVGPRDGRVDVDALAAFEPALRAAQRELRGILRRLQAAPDAWLVNPVRTRVDRLRDEIVRAQEESAALTKAVRIVPRLLGAEGERRWFLAVSTTAELRGAGGLIGNWGIITAGDGVIELPIFERIQSLYRDVPFDLHVDADWDARYIERFGLDRFPQNLLASPDLPSGAAAIRQMATQAGLGPIDGVIVVDPAAFAAVLELTGAVAVDGWPEPLTASNAEEILLHRQYLVPDAPGRPDFLADATRAVFDRLTTGQVGPPLSVVRTLGPMIEESHLQLWSFRDDESEYLDALGTASRLEQAAPDSLALVTQNGAQSKLDWFLRRSIRYDVQVGEGGVVSATLELRLKNDATGPLSDYFAWDAGGFGLGQNRQMVSLYSPLDVGLVTVEGIEVAPDSSTENGFGVTDVFVTIDPGEEIDVRFELHGSLRPAAERYRLEVHHQPTVAPDHLTVVVNGRTVHDGQLERDITIAAG